MFAIIYARNKGVFTAMLTNEVTKILLCAHSCLLVLLLAFSAFVSDPMMLLVLHVMAACVALFTSSILCAGYLVQRRAERDLALETIYRLEQNMMDV